MYFVRYIVLFVMNENENLIGVEWIVLITDNTRALNITRLNSDNTDY